MVTKNESPDYGLECLETSGDDFPLCVGEDWLVFPNYAAAKIVAQLLTATTGCEFRIVDLSQTEKKDASS